MRDVIYGVIYTVHDPRYCNTGHEV